MQNFDFDSVPARLGTGCVKWDAPAPVPVEGDVIPMWVADMDWKVAPCITKALEQRIQHGVFGYSIPPREYFECVRNWFRDRHGWAPETGWMQYTTGVVPAISAVIKALTSPGDKVLIQTPVYNCFFSSIRNNACAIEASPLLVESLTPTTFTYTMDLDDLESRCADPAVKVMLLCNPHNPAGRVWTQKELEAVAGICAENGVTVVSDEIHCDIVAPGVEYTPFGTVARGENWVVLCSASKAFNIAGLQMANIISPSEELRAKIDRAVNDNEICDVNCLGWVASMAAFSPEGAAWLDGMNEHVAENYALLCRRFAEELPLLGVASLEGTYLAWVDISPLGITSQEVENSLLLNEKVWINAGKMYGCDDFIRINLAAPLSLVEEGLERIIKGLKRIQNEKSA